MRIDIGNFSRAYDLYALTAPSGLCAVVSPLGAALQKIAVPDALGREVSLALGFPGPQPYESLSCYAGASLGPNAGRIAGGRLRVCGEEHWLRPNEGANQLHGGAHNLSAQLWRIEELSCRDRTASILLSAAQPHGLDGWPGERVYTCRYTLSGDGVLTAEYTARSDRPTYFNLSNHSYWNLSGDFSRPALDQTLTVEADQVCVNRADHLPAALLPVEGTAFDLRRGRTVGGALRSARTRAELEQFAAARGFNHAYLLNGGPGLKRACALRDPRGGRELELWTDAPGVVVYSGGFLPAGLEVNGGGRSVPSCAIALEAQDLPDCSRLYPSAFRPALPGEVWRRVIQFRFHLPPR